MKQHEIKKLIEKTSHAKNIEIKCIEKSRQKKIKISCFEVKFLYKSKISSSSILSFKNIEQHKLFEDNLERCFRRKYEAVLKALSKATDVAGVIKYSDAIRDKSGKWD